MMNQHTELYMTLLLFLSLLTFGGSQVNRDNDFCMDEDVRLENGMNEYEGRVEFCYQGIWGTVCDDDWGPEEAATVCWQLNFTINGKGTPVHDAYFGQGTGTTIYYVQCQQTESRLSSCYNIYYDTISDYWNDHSCQDAGVICRGSSNCSDGDVRLAEGSNEWEGRVEICFNRVWGTVCDDGWDDVDAWTVCQQMIGERDGIRLAGAIASERHRVIDGSGPIYLTNVQCNSSNNRLIDCEKQTNIGVCNHEQDAGAACKVQQISTTVEPHGSITPDRSTTLTAAGNNITPTATASDQLLINPVSSYMYLRPPSTKHNKANIQVTTTSDDKQIGFPMPYAPIFGTIGAALLLALLVSILTTGILVILKRKRRHDQHVREYSSVQNNSTDNPVYYHNGADYAVIQPMSSNQLKETTHLSVNGSVNDSTSNLHPEDIDSQELHQSMGQLPTNEMQGMYETPHSVAMNTLTDIGSEAERNSVNDDYSKLNVNDVRYATLEPHIMGNKRNEREPTSVEGGYSLLQHT